MNRKNYSDVVAAAAVALLIYAAHGSAATGVQSDWSYSGSSGPSFWGTINPEYAACASGQQQSPLNVTVRPPFLAGGPSIMMRASHMNVSRVPNNIMFGCAETERACGTIKFKGTTYRLQGIHFHFPSEHTLNGVRYAMEGHFVHKSAKGELAVLGVMFDSEHHACQTNAEIESLLRAAASLETKTKKEKNMVVGIQSLYKPGSKICTVKGSLTTPPCTEGVRWFVSSGVLRVSPAQVARFEKLIGGKNARPLQKLNGRAVQCFR